MKCKQNWKVLREGPDLKWRSYEPHPEAQTVEEFLAITPGKPVAGRPFAGQ
jgi:hypothetical protein